MREFFCLLLIGLLCASSYFPVAAQTPSPQDQDDVIRVRTNEVKLDIVVKDKKGRLVRELTPTDFEIYEDGVRQQIESFRFVLNESNRAGGVRKPEAKESPGGPAGPETPGSTHPGVIALVFDRLSPEARSLARKAGMTYAQEGIVAGDFTGVFGIDLSLRTLQSFTDNGDLIREAIDRATSASTSGYTSTTAQVRQGAERSAALDQRISSLQSEAAAAGAARDGGGAAAAGAAVGQAAIEQQFVDMQNRIYEQFETLERDQQGFATINSLLAVINPMRNLPGRKTIIFFSEGLALPASVQTKFPAVISAANRANVSIYTIDSAGLRIESGTSEAAKEINSLAARRMQQVGRGSDVGTSGPYMKALERNEDLLRLDPRSGLGQLADETGGFLIRDTNDLSAGIRRISDDMRGYYLITYVPKNDDYDGRFRQISIKMNQPNFDVQTRKGYYAVESVSHLPVLDYEAPALAAARNARSGINKLPLRVGAFSFPASNRTGLALVLAEAPMSLFSLTPSTDKKTYSSSFSIVALIRNQSNQVVQKMSQHYPLTGTIETLDAAKKGELLFYRETQLPPGSYSLELIAYDAPSGRTGISTSAIEIPPATETRPRLSSVAVLKRAERLTPEEQKQNQPLHFGELIVYPNLGDPILKSTSKQLAFFFTAWPINGNKSPLQVTAEILQGERRLGQTTTQLPSPDEHGQIKYASAFPLDKFAPGNYELKITIGEATNPVSRSTRFTVAP